MIEGPKPAQGKTRVTIAEGARATPDTDGFSGTQVFRQVNGKGSRQYGFGFGLWPRQIVGNLITQRFDVTLSLVSAGALLARVGVLQPEAIASLQVA